MRGRAAGLWDRPLGAAPESCDGDIVMIDASRLRVRHMGDPGAGDGCVGRSRSRGSPRRGGLTTKIHAPSPAPKSRPGRDQIGYVKRLEDGSFLYLEEVKGKRRELAAVSLRKYPATKDVEGIAATVFPTPEVMAGMRQG